MWCQGPCKEFRFRWQESYLMISNKSKISLFSLIVYIHCILMFLTWCYHTEVYHNADHNEGPDDVCSQQFNEKKLHVSILNFLKWKKPWKLDEKQEAQSKLKMKKIVHILTKKDLLGIKVEVPWMIQNTSDFGLFKFPNCIFSKL